MQEVFPNANDINLFLTISPPPPTPSMSLHCKPGQYREFENGLLHLPDEYAQPNGNNCQLLSERGSKFNSDNKLWSNFILRKPVAFIFRTGFNETLKCSSGSQETRQ